MKTVELGQQLGDQASEASGYFTAASSLAGRKKFTEAIELCKRAIAIADSSNQPLSIYQANSMMGTILKKAGKYKEAIPFFEKGFHMLADADIYDRQIADSYASLSECYEKTGNYSKSLSAFKTSAKITDSITRKDNIRKATELTLNYEFAKKEQATKAEQQKQKELANAKQLALFVGLVLAMILAFVALNGYRTKRKANYLLRRQKQEIQSTLTELKATQVQLIQSEKMASLGELTAGIAHEIQNPLNFVNNFAEVSIELSEELKEEIDKSELPTSEKENLEMLVNDLVQNQQKINHHGKRADAIVKGMLLHSRTNTGQKEPTDINALADEYLRLSYHGLRAKEKSFNATFETDFDEKIEKINIVPQDVGRVLLNLFTNAFYSVMEKKKNLPVDAAAFEPTVSVCTKKIDGKVEVRVKDNGTGIPQKVLDKIFHPFFTTKPAGQGTGLGLSLSYDVITNTHGGTIKVETREGEGAEFIITLPVG
jgi:signal transduction histidine kinase